ncbi:unnamed protein product, partial [Closterium sp. Yama58-4]
MGIATLDLRPGVGLGPFSLGAPPPSPLLLSFFPCPRAALPATGFARFVFAFCRHLLPPSRCASPRVTPLPMLPPATCLR